MKIGTKMYEWSEVVRLEMWGPLKLCGGKQVSIFCVNTLSHLDSFLGGTHYFLGILEILCIFTNMYLNFHAFFPTQICGWPSIASVAFCFPALVIQPHFLTVASYSVVWMCYDLFN